MARKQTLQIAQSEGLERVVVAAVSRLGVLAPPWIVLALLAIGGAISHAQWGDPPAVTWATMAGTLSTVMLTLLTWAVSHHRGLLGRCHSTATTLFAGLWFTIATITGVPASFTLGALFFGGATLAIGWNIRAVIRQAGPGEGGHADPLGWVFDQAKGSFGFSGARVRTREVSDHKIKGKLELPAGEKSPSDAIKKTEYIEGGMQFPPGSVHLAPDEDDASQMHVTVTDPRAMRRPLPWTGAYAPGHSIAVALRIGLWQDMDPVQHTITGHHLQMMGMSGAGKSIGGAWNYLAEIITRYDAAVFGTDITKGEQTLGPLRPALHRLETTKAGARKLLHDIHGKLKERTDWLAERGYQKWVEGCGLTYWVWWLEEFPDVYDSWSEKDQEKFLSVLKALRSAGGTIVMSLQRSDFTQMPTLARGQLAKMCFGVAEDSDASFGLSDAQKDAEARPELWQNHPEHQGKAYLDAPSIPRALIAMPLRTFAWGKTDRESHANITAHAAAWPATAKDVDPFTAAIADPSGSAARPGHAIPMPAAGTAHGTAQATVPIPGTEDGAHPGEAVSGAHSGADVSPDGELLAAAAELVIATRYASTEMLQRKLRLGHTECLRLLEALERQGIVGPQPVDGSARPVLADAEDAAERADELREDGDAVAEYLRTEDPSPDITAGPDDEIPEGPDDGLETTDDGPARKLSSAAARGLVHDWVRHRAAIGQPKFAAGDSELGTIRTQAGMTSRGWIYKVLDGLVDLGVLDKDEEGATTTFTIVSLDPLDDADREEEAA